MLNCSIPFYISWEQRKLCDIADKVTEKNANTNITETFTNSAEFGIVSQRDYFDHDISNFNNLSGYYVVQSDDFVYNPRISVTAPVGPINRNKLSRKGVMSPLYTVFRVKNIDFTFLEWYFKSEYWHGFMRFNGDSGARSDRFSIKDETMFQMPLPYPDRQEQEHIGKLLSKYDNLITLHQRKQNKQISGALSKKCYIKIANSWEQREAETLFISYAEKGFPDLPVLSATQDKGMVFRDDEGKIVFHDKTNEIGYKRVQPGQFVIHLRSFQGGFAHSNILGITSPAYTIFGFKEGEKQYDLFWKCIFSSPDFIRRLESVTYGIRDGRSISYDEFLTMKFIIPEYNEQVKIATHLIKTDNLITLHQRKHFAFYISFFSCLESFEKCKKTNSWEQRKLCDIADKVTEKNANTNITETFTNSAEFGIVSQRDYFDHDISNFNNLSGYYVVQSDDFVYNPRISVTAPVGPINRNKLSRKGVMSPLYTVFRVKNIDFTFLEWYFKSEYWHGFMRFNGDSGARSDRFSIKDETMFQMPLPYPDRQEQEHIGKLLSKYDNLITLHQRKFKDFHGGFL